MADYPHYFRERTCVLRYISPLEVCVVSYDKIGSQLQVQHLEAPRLLHSAQAVSATSADFLDGYHSAGFVATATAQDEVRTSTEFQKRGDEQDGWFYRNDGSQSQVRVNLWTAPADDKQQANIIYEDFGGDSRFRGVTHKTDQRRQQPSTEQEFMAAFNQAMRLVDIAATGTDWQRLGEKGGPANA